MFYTFYDVNQQQFSLLPSIVFLFSNWDTKKQQHTNRKTCGRIENLKLPIWKMQTITARFCICSYVPNIYFIYVAVYCSPYSIDILICVYAWIKADERAQNWWSTTQTKPTVYFWEMNVFFHLNNDFFGIVQTQLDSHFEINRRIPLKMESSTIFAV